MCKQFVVRAAEPFRLADLWPITDRLERFERWLEDAWGSAEPAALLPDGTPVLSAGNTANRSSRSASAVTLDRHGTAVAAS